MPHVPLHPLQIIAQLLGGCAHLWLPCIRAAHVVHERGAQQENKALEARGRVSKEHGCKPQHVAQLLDGVGLDVFDDAAVGLVEAGGHVDE